MAPYQRVKGKEWTIAFPAIGETVDYKHKTRHKLEMRWDRGIFLGIKIDSSERIVGTDKGTFAVQSIRRVPEAERYNSDAIKSLKGLPWRPVAEGPDDRDALELPAPIEMQPDCPEVPPVPVEAGDRSAIRGATTSRRRTWRSTTSLQDVRPATPPGETYRGLASRTPQGAGRGLRRMRSRRTLEGVRGSTPRASAMRRRDRPSRRQISRRTTSALIRGRAAQHHQEAAGLRPRVPLPGWRWMATARNERRKPLRRLPAARQEARA